MDLLFLNVPQIPPSPQVNIQPQENVTIYKDVGANFQIPLSNSRKSPNG